MDVLEIHDVAQRRREVASIKAHGDGCPPAISHALRRFKADREASLSSRRLGTPAGSRRRSLGLFLLRFPNLSLLTSVSFGHNRILIIVKLPATLFLRKFTIEEPKWGPIKTAGQRGLVPLSLNGEGQG